MPGLGCGLLADARDQRPAALALIKAMLPVLSWVCCPCPTIHRPDATQSNKETPCGPPWRAPRFRFGGTGTVFGVLGLVSIVVPMDASNLLAPDGGGEATVGNLPLLPMASIASSIIGVTLGIYAIQRSDRHWPTWVGLAAGGLTVGFWLFFVVGEMLYQH